MPINDKNIKSRDVVGKKYIRARFSVTVFIVAVELVLVFISFIKNDIDAIIYLFPFSVMTLPVVVFDILKGLGIIGQYCVLSNDKLYYFRAKTEICGKREKSNGYVYYNDIKNVGISHYARGGFALVLQGDKFEIVVDDASRKLVDEIKHRSNLDNESLSIYDKIGKCYNKYSDVVYYDKNGIEYKINGDMIINLNDKNMIGNIVILTATDIFITTKRKWIFTIALTKIL